MDRGPFENVGIPPPEFTLVKQSNRPAAVPHSRPQKFQQATLKRCYAEAPKPPTVPRGAPGPKYRDTSRVRCISPILAPGPGTQVTDHSPAQTRSWCPSTAPGRQLRNSDRSSPAPADWRRGGWEPRAGYQISILGIGKQRVGQLAEAKADGFSELEGNRSDDGL